jgi:hypothetical protein
MVEDTHFTAAGAADQSLYGRADELQVVSDLVGGLAEGVAAGPRVRVRFEPRGAAWLPVFAPDF